MACYTACYSAGSKQDMKFTICSCNLAAAAAAGCVCHSSSHSSSQHPCSLPLTCPRCFAGQLLPAVPACSWVHHPGPGQTYGTLREGGGGEEDEENSSSISATSATSCVLHLGLNQPSCEHLWSVDCSILHTFKGEQSTVVPPPPKHHRLPPIPLRCVSAPVPHRVSGSSVGCAGAPAAAAASQSAAWSASQGSTSARSPSERRILPGYLLRCRCRCRVLLQGWKGWEVGDGAGDGAGHLFVCDCSMCAPHHSDTIIT